MMEFDSLATVAHRIEDMFFIIREGTMSVVSEENRPALFDRKLSISLSRGSPDSTFSTSPRKKSMDWNTTSNNAGRFGNEILDMYIYETGTLLEQLETIVLEAEKADTFSQENVNEIFRIMHTIKDNQVQNVPDLDRVTGADHRTEQQDAGQAGEKIRYDSNYQTFIQQLRQGQDGVKVLAKLLAREGTVVTSGMSEGIAGRAWRPPSRPGCAAGCPRCGRWRKSRCSFSGNSGCPPGPRRNPPGRRRS